MKNHIYFPKNTELKEIVRVFFQSRGRNELHRQEVIIPRGIVEVVFNFEDTLKITAEIESEKTVLPRCFITGYKRLPSLIHHGENQDFFGVVFQPSIIKHRFGYLASEFADKYIDLTLIDSSFNSLWYQLGEKGDFKNRVRILKNWIYKQDFQLTHRERLINNFLDPSTGVITSAAKLSHHLCYSTRHLSRKFQEIAGMNIEQILCYMKYLKSVNLMHFTNLQLTEIAHICHFADQSHFSNTFKSFAKLTPREYRVVKGSVPGHYYKDVR